MKQKMSYETQPNVNTDVCETEGSGWEFVDKHNRAHISLDQLFEHTCRHDSSRTPRGVISFWRLQITNLLSLLCVCVRASQ